MARTNKKREIQRIDAERPGFADLARATILGECAGGLYRGIWKVLGDRLGVSPRSARTEADFLGVTKPRKPWRAWTDEETAIIRRMRNASIEDMVRTFRRRGFSRSPTSIRHKRAELGCRPDRHSVRELAEIFNVSPGTVLRWISALGLPATLIDNRHRVREADLAPWLWENRGAFDHTRVDRHFLADMFFLAGQLSCRAQRKREAA